MDLWSWDEIYIGATRFESLKISSEVLTHVFKHYSRSARDCYELSGVQDLESPKSLSGS